MKQRNKSRAKHRRGHGVLAVIATMFLLSAVLRLGMGAEQAIARSLAEAAKDDGVTDCDIPEDMAAVLQALSDRESDIAERDTKLQERMQILATAEREIDEKLTRLTEAEESLRATIALADTAAEDDINRLVSVYEAMKPKDAATLFEEMSPDFAAGFLGRMSPDAAAGVLAGLSPQAAYSLSAILAGRNAEIGQE